GGFGGGEGALELVRGNEDAHDSILPADASGIRFTGGFAAAAPPASPSAGGGHRGARPAAPVTWRQGQPR
ncbi:MAG TPA: hypothetical protein VFD99_06430, partial [Arthrobacter sp.]|nr:hypothetical protein [Arthrobacter sp.]